MRHVDYVHWNPMKHGLVKNLKFWPYASFHRYVKEGIYPEDWADSLAVQLEFNEQK